MSVFAPSAQDRLLDLGDILRELVTQGRVDQNDAEQCLAIRRSAVKNQQHPLEFLAAQQVEEGRDHAGNAVVATGRLVMLGLVPSIHVFPSSTLQDVDGRHKGDHDGRKPITASSRNAARRPRPSSA